jgi:hypothetical protein
MRPRIAVGTLMLLFVSLPAMAQNYSVCTRVGLWRPGCPEEATVFPQKECVVEVTNFDPNYWYKVAFVGQDKVASPGPSACSGSGTPCQSTVGDSTHEYVLPPYSQNNSCQWYSSALPSNGQGCHSCSDINPNDPNNGCPYPGSSDCDNRRAGATCPDCEPTCGNPSTEWCVELVYLHVYVTAYSSNGVRWTNLNSNPHLVASKDANGSFGSISVHSYCTNHQAIFEPCSPPPNFCTSE